MERRSTSMEVHWVDNYIALKEDRLCSGGQASDCSRKRSTSYLPSECCPSAYISTDPWPAARGHGSAAT